jgi:hypothetical protein
MNLVLTGEAVSGVFDGVQRLGGEATGRGRGEGGVGVMCHLPPSL